MKYWLFSLFLLSFVNSFAHQPDLSTTMLYQREDGKWMLQITSSLTAFQAEIKTRFFENAYADVEDFERLVVQHLRENVVICANRKDTLLLGNAFVKLGHETSVVFEVNGMPENLASVTAKNTSFENIHRNQSALVILKKGISHERLVLNNDNGHSVSLVLDGGKLKPVSANQSMWAFGYLWLGLSILCVGVTGAVFYKRLFLKTGASLV